jgi:ferredoxin/flavodoxin---NADP+ reductase
MKQLPVESINNISKDIYEIKLKRDDSYKFEVGKCVAIYGEDGITSRPYSFSGGENDDTVSFLIRELPDGVISSYLRKLKKGDMVKVSNPYGWFTPGKYEDSVFIATGTGISPFLSSIRSGKLSPSRLYWGMRNESDYTSLIQYIEDTKLTRTTIMKLCISNTPGRYGAMGYVTGHLENDFQTQWIDKNLHFYLCGLDKMIEDCRIILSKYGVEEENIHIETFFTTEGIDASSYNSTSV